MGLNANGTPGDTQLAILPRLLLASFLTTILLSLACAGLFVSGAPEIVSLAIQPFSLLLMPGLLVASLPAGRHELDRSIVMAASVCFHLAFFYAALGRWPTRAHNRSR